MRKINVNIISKFCFSLASAFSLILLLLNSTYAANWPEALKNDMQQAGIAIADNWLDETAPENANWAWGEGVLAYGLAKMAHSSDRQDYLAWLERYIAYHDDKGKTMEWSDHLSPGISALYITRYLDESREIKTISGDVVDYIMAAPRTPNQGMLLHFGYRYDRFPYNILGYPEAWVDSLFHITPNLVLYSQITGDGQYLEEAIKQVDIFTKNLQDPETGLFAHAVFDNDNKDYPVPSWDSDKFWARGNGWALVSLVELLAAMPVDHIKYSQLLASTQVLEAALRAAQGEDGRYHTLATDPDTYYETAGTALILYAMAKGYSMGIFSEYTRDAVIKGANGLLAHTLDWSASNNQAKVKYTSTGTNPDPWRYAIVPRKSQVDYGVGAWLLLAAQIMAD